LVVGTYGRGFWILDDITPLQQLTKEVTASDAHLFEPRQPYRFRPITSPMTMANDPSAGEDPPGGASIHYWLAKEPEGEVKIKVTNTTGETLRTLEGTKEVGINRVWWDLRGEPSTEIKMRTKPLYADWVELGKERWRPAPVGRISVLAPPGTYTVTLVVGDNERSRELRVLKDPHSEGTEEDIRLQTEMLLELREDMNAAAEAINHIEWMRRQLYDLKDVVGELGDEEAKTIVESVDEIDGSLIGIEEKLFQLKITGTGQDRVRWPAKLAGRFAHLAGAVAVADFPPTDQHREVHQVLKGRLLQAQQELDELIQNVIPSFNRSLEEHQLPRVVTGSK
jgi:hypothetical protein